MRKYVFAAGCSAAALLMASGASAQTAPMGEELYGQTVNVQFANGDTNSIYFGRDGNALITGEDGMTMNATWGVANGDLCLRTGTGSECWDYTNRFVANRPATWTSSCGATSTWTALGTSAIPTPPPAVVPAPAPAPRPAPAPAPVQQPLPDRSGERG